MPAIALEYSRRRSRANSEVASGEWRVATQEIPRCDRLTRIVSPAFWKPIFKALEASSRCETPMTGVG